MKDVKTLDDSLNVEMVSTQNLLDNKHKKTDNSSIKNFSLFIAGFIAGTSILMGVAEAAAPGKSCKDSFKLLFSGLSPSASSALSYIGAAFVFAAAFYLTYILFTDSMEKTTESLPELTADYKLVMYTVLYLFTFRWSKIYELKTKKGKELQNTKTAIKAFFIALLTVISTLLAIASAIACAALAANSLIAIWGATPMIVVAMIAFVAEIIATTCLNNVYFVQTLDTAITDRPEKGWFIWYLEEISGKAGEDHKDNSGNAKRWEKAPIAFVIKGILFLGLSTCVSIIVPCIFYSQLVGLNSQLDTTINPLLNKLGLPAIPHLSIATIYAVLFSAALVLIVFRIRALWMAADKIYGLIVNKYFNDGKQETKNKAISPEIKKKLKIGFILALVNGTFYGYLSFGAKDSLPDFLKHNKYLCFGFLIGACFALGSSSVSANFASWEDYYNPSTENETKTFSLFVEGEDVDDTSHENGTPNKVDSPNCSTRLCL